MARRKKVNWVEIIIVVSAAITGLADLNQIMRGLSDGVVDWKAFGFFILLLLLVAFLLGLKRGFRILKRLKINLIFVFFATIAVLGAAPNAYACTSSTICPIIINGKPSVSNLHATTDDKIGAMAMFKLALDAGTPSGDLPGVHRTVIASGGDIIRNILCPSLVPSPFLYAQVTLRINGRDYGPYPPDHLSPGSCQSFTYKIPDKIGSDPVQVDVYITFAILGESGSMPEQWNGTISIGTEDSVQAPPAVLPSQAPPANPSPTTPPTPVVTPTPISLPTQPAPTEINQAGSECEPLEVNQALGAVDWPYIVDKDDTLQALANFFYKDPNKWVDIYSANRPVIGKYSEGIPVIHSGQMIIIPGVQSPFLYRVQPGDSLGMLSKMAYGLGAGCRWRTIFDHNSDVIGADPNRLNPGQVLSIFARKKLKNDQLWVLPDESITQIALGYYVDDGKKGLLCKENGKKPDGDCNLIQPLDTIILPDLPPATQYAVLPGDTWQKITEQCYHEVRQGLVMAVIYGNRRIVGDNPLDLHEGQILELRGCKP